MWTLPAAIAVVQSLAPAVRACDYHVMLGGGVLHRGESTKDLDLFFMPLNASTGQREELFGLLGRTFGPLSTIRDAPDYHTDSLWHWSELLKGTWDGKRVDLFIGTGVVN